MSVLTQAGAILSTPQGGLVYYLLILWAVVAGLGMAWGEWRRTRGEQAQRLLIALAGLFLARLAYALGVLLTAADWFAPLNLLPPLERCVDVISLGLIAWAVLSPAQQQRRLWTAGAAGNTLLALVACAGAVVLWTGQRAQNPTLDYNLSWQAVIWSLWQVGLILLAAWTVVRDRQEGWGTFAAAMLILLAGRFMQLLYPGVAAQLPTWERLANLVAYPLLAVGVYQHIVSGLYVHSRQLQDISQASLDQIKSLLFLFEATQRMSGSLDLTTVLESAAQGIAHALGADQCAIAFPAEDNPGQMRLAAIYNPARQGRGEGVAFPTEYQLTIQQAMRRKHYVIAEEADNVQLKVLFALMGSSEIGPLLVQPLVADREAIGAIIVGNARSQRPFTPNEAKLCQSMAEQLVGAIQNARRYQAVQEEVQELRQTLKRERLQLEQTKAHFMDLTDRLAKLQAEIEERQRQAELAREARNALEIKLVSSRAENQALSERIAVLESDLAQAHANVEAQMRWYEEELARRQTEWQETALPAGWMAEAMQTMTAGVLYADAEGRILEANMAAEILLEQEGEQLRGLPLSMVSDDERWNQAILTAGQGEVARLTMPVGERTLMCELVPLTDLDAEGEPVTGLLVIMQDVTAEMEDQRRYRETVASLAEELRTPMTTIVSYADLLLGETMGILGGAQRKFVLRIKAAAERMVQMTNDLTRLAGEESPWISPRRQKINMHEFLETMVANLCLDLEERDLSLDVVLPDDLPPIEADPDYLRQILHHLLSNACLASVNGGRIRVEAVRSRDLPFEQEQAGRNGDGFVLVSIQDSGGGLSEEALARVFDRARPSRTPPGLGESGAGLALVKTLVEAHGGRLWVESRDGVGATFSFVLPIEEPVE